MAAQTVKEVTTGEAQAFIATPGAKRIAQNVYGIPSRGVTVTVKPGSRPGMTKLIIMKGCAC